MSKVNFLFLILFALPTYGAVVNYKPLQMAVDASNKIFIQGFDGNIKIIQKPQNMLTVSVTQVNPDNNEVVKALLDEWSFNMQKDGPIVRIVIRGPSAKADWIKLMTSPQWPRFNLEIVAPAIPAEIYWNRGNVSIDNWNSSIILTLLEGNVSIGPGSGDLRLSQQQGAMTIKNREGNVAIENYQSNTDVESIKGRLKIDQFIGAAKVKNVTGQLDVKNFKSSMTFMRVDGPVEYYNRQGPLKLEQVSGDIRGKSESGSVSMQLLGEGNINVSSKEGSVNIQTRDSGAMVNLQTEEGRFSVPSYLPSANMGSVRLVKGRLRGKENGSIYVKSSSGNITVR